MKSKLHDTYFNSRRRRYSKRQAHRRNGIYIQSSLLQRSSLENSIGSESLTQSFLDNEKPVLHWSKLSPTINLNHINLDQEKKKKARRNSVMVTSTPVKGKRKEQPHSFNDENSVSSIGGKTSTVEILMEHIRDCKNSTFDILMKHIGAPIGTPKIRMSPLEREFSGLDISCVEPETEDPEGLNIEECTRLVNSDELCAPSSDSESESDSEEEEDPTQQVVPENGEQLSDVTLTPTLMTPPHLNNANNHNSVYSRQHEEFDIEKELEQVNCCISEDAEISRFTSSNKNEDYNFIPIGVCENNNIKYVHSHEQLQHFQKTSQIDQNDLVNLQSALHIQFSPQHENTHHNQINDIIEDNLIQSDDQFQPLEHHHHLVHHIDHSKFQQHINLDYLHQEQQLQQNHINVDNLHHHQYQSPFSSPIAPAAAIVQSQSPLQNSPVREEDNLLMVEERFENEAESSHMNVDSVSQHNSNSPHRQQELVINADNVHEDSLTEENEAEEENEACEYTSFSNSYHFITRPKKEKVNPDCFLTTDCLDGYPGKAGVMEMYRKPYSANYDVIVDTAQSDFLADFDED